MAFPPAPMPAPRRAYRRRTTRWLRPNRYDAVCYRCRQYLPAGAGEARFDGYQWIVRHPGGRCHTVAYTQYVSLDSPAWQARRAARLMYAHHRCEWRALGLVRCRTTHPLDCHHRHYEHLGSEPLRDLIVLCPTHHVVADRRRRSWGRWPLFGTPIWEPRVDSEAPLPQISSPPMLSSTGPPPPPPHPDPRTMGAPPDGFRSTRLSRCPVCGFDAVSENGICRNCGKALPPPPKP